MKCSLYHQRAICRQLELSNGRDLIPLANKYKFKNPQSLFTVYRRVRGMSFSQAGYGTSNGRGGTLRKSKHHNQNGNGSRRNVPATNRNYKRHIPVGEVECGYVKQVFLTRLNIGCHVLIEPTTALGLCDDCRDRLRGNRMFCKLEREEIYRSPT